MKLCNDTITVFNAKLDQTLDATVYVPTVIHGVSWYGGEKSTVDANGLKAASQYTIRDRKSTRLNSSHSQQSRMPSSA